MHHIYGSSSMVIGAKYPIEKDAVVTLGITPDYIILDNQPCGILLNEW